MIDDENFYQKFIGDTEFSESHFMIPIIRDTLNKLYEKDSHGVSILTSGCSTSHAKNFFEWAATVAGIFLSAFLKQSSVEKKYSPHLSHTKVESYKLPAHNYRKDFDNRKISRENQIHAHGLNQSMIILKLCRYLDLTNRSGLKQLCLPGLCSHLSLEFLDKFNKDLNTIVWDALLKDIKKWDGEESGLLRYFQEFFEKLINLINKPPEKHYSYIGDELLDFLISIKAGSSLVLRNYKHEIAVYKSRTEWIIYEPNNPFGHDSCVEASELMKKIECSLGKQVLANKPYTLNKSIENTICDYPKFFREGGFLTLFCDPILFEHLKDRDNVEEHESLRGLMIRNVHGLPAWLVGIKNKSTKLFFITYLQIFMIRIRNPLKLLEKSLCDLDDMDKLKAMELLRENLGGLPSIDGLLTLQGNPHAELSGGAGKGDDSASYETDRKLVDKYKILFHPNDAIRLDFMEDIIPEKLLIQTYSDQLSLRCLVDLYSRFKQKEILVFLVQNPDDLYTGDSSQSISKFLSENEDHANPVILINYDSFESQDIIQFNSMLDDIRKVDGVDLPKHCKIIGVQNTNHPNAYRGMDFISRFTEVKNYECDAQGDFHSAIASFDVSPFDASFDFDEIYVVDFFNDASRYTDRLLGGYQLVSNRLVFVEGELSPAKLSGKKIVIANAPVNNVGFRLLMEKLRIDGKIDYTDCLFMSGYYWKDLVDQVVNIVQFADDRYYGSCDESGLFVLSHHSFHKLLCKRSVNHIF